MNKLKHIDCAIVSELIKNSRLSDRQVAKMLGTSQPTVTRRRRQLEKEGLLDYTAVPDLKKLGFEILAITFGNRATHQQYPELKIQKAKEFTERHPNLIFVSSGIGLGSDRVAISVHKDYADYSNFKKEVFEEWKEIMTVTDSFVISLVSDSMLRNLTFKYLAEQFKKGHIQQKT